MAKSELDLPDVAGEESPQRITTQGEIYFAPNLVHSPGPDEEAIVEKLQNRFGTILVNAMKDNDVLPPNLIDPDEGQK